MRFKAILLAGAAASALFVGSLMPSLATADPIPSADSYAALLEPVPDARALLAADDAMRSQQPRLQTVQYYDRHHHHHHHSWHWYRDNGYSWDGGGWVVIPRYHHHHHSWQWYRGNGYVWNGWAWTPRPRYHHHHHHHEY
jgi:hypothetical protein